MSPFSRGALLLCLAGLGAFPQTAEKKEAAPARSALDKATLEAYVRHLFVWGKNIKVEVMDAKQSPDLPDFYTVTVRASAGQASQDENFLVSHDGHKIMRAVIFDVNQNPFKPDLDKLNTQFQPSMGTEGAPVVLVVFTDFECPVCKQEAEMLRQNLLNAYPKDVRLYLKDFPLVQIHPWAKIAAIAGRCVFRQNPAAFWDYHDWVYAHQAEITADNFKAKLAEFAATKDKQIDAMQFNSCVATRATDGEVERSLSQGKDLRINATPTMFINGRRIDGQIPWPNLRDIIDYEIEYQKTAKNAGEDCGCEVKLPSPLGKQAPGVTAP